MNIRWGFSPARFWAIVVKEFIQMHRDRLTFGMMVGIPLLLIVLFGFAINADPKHLPAAVLMGRRTARCCMHCRTAITLTSSGR